MTPSSERVILRIHFHHTGDEELYHQLLTVLDGISPRWQALPPSAADLDITGSLKYFDRSPHDLAQVLALRTAALYGTQVTIGGGNSRLLAAMAADATPPGGITIVDAAPEAVAGFLRPRPVHVLPGIGPATANLLTRHGLHTIGALADTPLLTLQRLLGKANGREIAARASGHDPRPVTPGAAPASVTARHDFPRDELDPAQHRRALIGLAEQTGAELRGTREAAGALTLTVRYADRSHTSRTRTLPEATSHSAALAQAAYRLYETFGLQRARVRGITLRASGLRPAAAAHHQLTLDPSDDKARRIEKAADAARARFGPDAVFPASLAPSP
ncbi:DNA polymerase Y family protein [Streptomyces lutosisoli]|uniref:UmuC domain-containing protein n=1 Tax=Streptomyces lutosisoli TaxID=2665721 RepID=A0ABW2VVV6_9ACTN